ncbi:MAG: HPF/RaiA family ribosome-associated protein [Alphaproteobacteria bacterium]|nr:HPF/RaiA family ribosome-associated protein [Alphaproteobacteria bacterium]MBV8409034.1 HPF/RaiA family ribosome-associated protein [Alphaproteobacteria bacterium]
MNTPLRVTFQNTPSSDAIRALIEEQVAHLERVFDRITACEVHFKLPDGNHRNGGLYEVRIHLLLPGGVSIDVDRTPGLDERFAEAQFAVTDAFRRARRRLQDQAKLMRHDVKSLHKRLDRTLDQPDRG